MAKGRKTGGRTKGTKNERTEHRNWAAQVVNDPEYRANFISRAKAGTLSGTVEAMLWYYAYGKPAEHHMVSGEQGGPIVLEITRYAND